MTESEKEELQEKALAVLRAMKKEPKGFFDSIRENGLSEPTKRDLEQSKVYRKLFPGDRKLYLEDKLLFYDRMNCIAKAQERFHLDGLKKFNERVRCKVTFKEKAESDDVQEFRDRLEHDRFKSLLNHIENRVTQTLKKGAHKENH